MYASLWIAVVLVAGAWAIPKAGNPSDDHQYHHSVRKDAPPVDSEAKREARQTVQSNDCPIGCPKGWNRWGFSSNCYKLPPQPAEGNTFWEWERRCQTEDPDAHVIVVNSIWEQAVGIVICLQYAATWLPNLGTSFMWLGGYTDAKDHWKFLDKTDQTGSLLFVGAAIAGGPNNTCLSADPWTLGFWATRPCDSRSGAAICEMPRKPVCGERGGMLPFAPIDINRWSLYSLFPKMPTIPFISSLLESLGFNKAIGYVGDTIKCYAFGWCPTTEPDAPKQLRPSCRWGCPPGWYSYGNVNVSTSQCYKFPQHNLDRWNRIYQGLEGTKSTFADAAGTCVDSESASRLMVINSPLELATIEAILKTFQWQNTNPGAFLWLGASGADGEDGWRYEDGSGEKGNVLMSLADLRSPSKGQCLAADLSNGGKWFQTSCDQTKGMYLCEMPMKPICDGLASGADFAFINVTDMTLQHLKELFPKMPDAPFLENVMSGQGDQEPISASGFHMNADGTGTDAAYIMCVKYAPGGWLAGNPSYKPEYKYLRVNDKDATIYGEWTNQPCNLNKGYAKYAFKVSATSALSVWSRCYNKGYDLAMPVFKATNAWSLSINTLAAEFSGWYPFQVGDQINEYYDKGWTVFSKIPRSKPTC